MCIRFISTILFGLIASCAHVKDLRVATHLDQIAVIGLTTNMSYYDIHKVVNHVSENKVSVGFGKDDDGYLIVKNEAFTRKVAHPYEWTLVESRQDIPEQESLELLKILGLQGAVVFKPKIKNKNQNNSHLTINFQYDGRTKFDEESPARRCIESFQSGEMPTTIARMDGNYVVGCELKHMNSIETYRLKISVINNEAVIDSVIDVVK